MVSLPEPHVLDFQIADFVELNCLETWVGNRRDQQGRSDHARSTTPLHSWKHSFSCRPRDSTAPARLNLSAYLLIDEQKPAAARATIIKVTLPLLLNYHNVWNAFV